MTNVIIERYVKEFSACIECGAEYFHAPLCERGAGLSGTELVRRIGKRAKTIRSKNLYCHCGESASGTAWIGYHNMTALVSVFPVCENHAYFESERPNGFIPDLITNSANVVASILNGFY